MPNQKKIIDFSLLGGPVFIGRPRGEAARSKFDLDKADREGQEVVVKIPDDTYQINSSYFLGLFGNSIKYYGNRKAFLDKYDFRCHERFIKTIERGITRALLEKRPLI